jgi:hypothetical protein
MKSTVIKLVIAILLAYFGWQLFDKGAGSPSDKTFQEYEKLCKTSVKTTGVLDTTYTETNIKILRGSSGTKLNTFNYKYKAHDQVYNGSFSMKGVPAKPTVDVWYDPSNASSHLTADPCKQYEFSKSKKYPGWYTYLGIPMLLIGIGLLYGLVKNGTKTLFGTNKRQQTNQ